MLIELIYGYLAGSLSLLTDGVHMACDMTALLIGLVVVYVKENNQNERYPFRLANLDSLAGLINSTFLVIMACQLFY